MPAARTGIAKRYAEAVFDIARAHGSFDRWSTELEAVAQLQKDPEVAALLATPAVGLTVKESIVTRALPGLSTEATNLVRLLLRRGRFALAPQIADHYRLMVNEHRGITTAEVTSAVALSAEELKAIERRLSAITGRQVVAEATVDRSILGGIVARIGDQLIDASVRGRLETLRRRLAPA